MKKDHKRKYSTRMEMLIEDGFHTAPPGELRLETGEIIRKSFKKLFSPALTKNITADGIVKKYYKLKAEAKAFDEGTGIYKDNTSLDKPNPTKSSSSTIKDLMFSAMQKSDNMTINVQGENITITFK